MNDLNYKKINRGHGGFVAMTLVIIISSLLMAFVYMESIESAQYFDATRLKKYRLMNHYNALSCIDQAILNISHDYFFELTSPVEMAEFNCTIDSITRENNTRIIKAYGNYLGIRVDREVRITVNDDGIKF